MGPRSRAKNVRGVLKIAYGGSITETEEPESVCEPTEGVVVAINGRLVDISNTTITAGIVLCYYVFKNEGLAKIEISGSNEQKGYPQIVVRFVVPDEVTRIHHVSILIKILVYNETSNEKIERGVLTEGVGVGVEVVVNVSQGKIEVVLSGDVRGNKGKLCTSSSHIQCSIRIQIITIL